MTCPVSWGCYRQLQRHHFGGYGRERTTFVRYDDLLPEWEELGELVESSSPSLTEQRLRAFYAVEAIYFFLIPMGHYPVDEIDMKQLFQVKRPRTSEGLENLIETCEQAERKLRIRRGQAQLMGQSHRPALKLMTSSMSNMESEVKRCKEAAANLRSSLDGYDPGPAKVGEIFGDLLITARTPMTHCMQSMKTMLSINLMNAISPWNQTNRFQV